MATVGQKLTFLMKNSSYNIADEAFGRALHVDRSTVSKWRSGSLRFDRLQYGTAAAEFFLQSLDRRWLLSLLGLPDTPPADDALVRRIVEFLFDGKDITVRPRTGGVTTGRPAASDSCFLGVQGLFDALSLLASHLEGVDEHRRQLSVYLSSEYCGLLLDPNVDLLWDYLYGVNCHRPVKIVFERWQETGRVTQILTRLIPFILQKKVELYYIPSSERFFCYNISFLSEDNCIVMTTEPAGSFGTSVSLYVDSPEFVVPMSKVMGKLERLARPMAKFIETARGETSCINAMLEQEGDLSALYDGVNLLHSPEDGFEALLAACGLNYQQRRHHVKRFGEQRDAFGQLLMGSAVREVFFVDAIDEYISAAELCLHELALPVARAQADSHFLEGLLGGMADALRDRPGLQVALARGRDCRGTVWRLKEDRAILLHRFDGAEKVCVYSENRLFIDHYTQLFEDAYSGKYTIRGRANVIKALEKRAAQIKSVREGAEDEQ